VNVIAPPVKGFVSVFKTQVLLPLGDNAGRAFAAEKITRIQERLVRKFGGYTAFRRSPAQGVWMHQGERYSDDIVVVEIFSATLDREWWGEFRRTVEHDLGQEHLVVYSQEIEQL